MTDSLGPGFVESETVSVPTNSDQSSDDHPYHEACDKCWSRFQWMRRRAENAEARLRLAKDALVRTGYFKPSEVGDDVAPRITEFLEAARRGSEKCRLVDDPNADYFINNHAHFPEDRWYPDRSELLASNLRIWEGIKDIVPEEERNRVKRALLGREEGLSAAVLREVVDNPDENGNVTVSAALLREALR